MSDAHLDVAALVAAVRSVVGDASSVPLHEPELGDAEKAALADCIDSTFVSSVGPYVDRFEAELAAFTGAGHAVAVVNGTAALQLALHVVGTRPGDEVLIPSLTFVATANAVHWCGAMPHLVDADRTTLGLDSVALAAHLEQIAEIGADGCRNRSTGRPIRAVVPMHVFGHPVDMPALTEVATRWGLAVVEDAAESLGSMIGDRHCGRFGRLAALSFNGNKILTTGGGGAILTDDPALAARCKHLSTTARVRHAWSFLHDEPGFNFRRPNVNAALGVAQLGRLPSALARKRRLTERYQVALAEIGGVRLFREPRGTHSNYWLQAILLNPEVVGRRDEILAALHAAGIQARPAWTPMHRLPMYADCPQAPLPVTDELAARIINLPSSPGLVHD